MRIKKLIAAVMSSMMLLSIVPSTAMAATTGWSGSDRNGWKYYTSTGSYVRNNWKKIGRDWYYFDSDGYMESNCYRDGYWINKYGARDSKSINGTWKSNSTGWWFEDSGWYPSSRWLKINGDYYYFDSNGYMESECYRDGYWLDEDGKWDTKYSHGTWKQDSTGWWYEDKGWYPTDQSLKIDGTTYKFDSNGYWNANYKKSSSGSGSSGYDKSAYDERTVYVSRSNKYHYVSNCSGMKKYSTMTLGEAKAKGAVGCKNCT